LPLFWMIVFWTLFPKLIGARRHQEIIRRTFIQNVHQRQLPFLTHFFVLFVFGHQITGPNSSKLINNLNVMSFSMFIEYQFHLSMVNAPWFHDVPCITTLSYTILPFTKCLTSSFLT
jgi:hypothetical protein